MTTPFGRTAAVAAQERADRSPAYRAARDEYERIEALRARNPIAAHLRERRMELGLTQEQVAHAVRTSHTNISRLERGQLMPKLTTLLRIAAVLDEEVQVCFEPSGGETARHVVPLRALLGGPSLHVDGRHVTAGIATRAATRR